MGNVYEDQTEILVEGDVSGHSEIHGGLRKMLNVFKDSTSGRVEPDFVTKVSLQMDGRHSCDAYWNQATKILSAGTRGPHQPSGGWLHTLKKDECSGLLIPTRRSVLQIQMHRICDCRPRRDRLRQG